MLNLKPPRHTPTLPTLAVDSIGTNPRFDGYASLKSALRQSALPRSTR